MTPLVQTYLDRLERERSPDWLAQSVACLVTPYQQLVVIESAAEGFMGRVSRGHLGIDQVGDSAVICFREGTDLTIVLDSVRRLPSPVAAKRTFFFALGSRSVRLVASTGQPGTQVFTAVRP